MKNQTTYTFKPLNFNNDIYFNDSGWGYDNQFNFGECPKCNSPCNFPGRCRPNPPPKRPPCPQMPCPPQPPCPPNFRPPFAPCPPQCEMPDADGIGEVGNAKCGDIMRMYIKVDKDTQVITDVKFMTFGCGSAIATSSIATEMIKGQPISKALELSNKAVVEALGGLPAHKIHCSVLAEEAVKAAVKDYYDKNGIAYDEECYKKGNCPCIHEHHHHED